MSDLEVIDTQNVIIKLQSDVINTLFTELMKHVSYEEFDDSAVTKKINLAAQLRNDIWRGI